MANPQLENGFTKISNEILDSLVKAGLLGSELQVLVFVIRKTYGWGKKRDIISLSQFIEGTNLSRPTMVKTLKNLISRNMLVKTALPRNRIAYMYQKNYEQWKDTKTLKHDDYTSKDRLTSLHGLSRGSKDGLTETSKDGLTHKRKKETIQKGISIKRYKPEFIK